MAEWSIIRKLAAEAYGFLERRKRSDGTSYVSRAAHGDSFPDDWIYDQISNCLESISGDDCEDDALEDAESAIDIYSSDLLDWAKGRGWYVDDAIRDGARTLDAAIIQGQQTMIGEIFDSIVTFLSNMADDLEEEEEDIQRKYELENPQDEMPPEAYDPEDSDIAENRRGLR